MDRTSPQEEPKLNLTDLDRRIWEEELADFIPSKIYDAHTHVYDMRSQFTADAQASKTIPQSMRD